MSRNEKKIQKTWGKVWPPKFNMGVEDRKKGDNDTVSGIAVEGGGEWFTLRQERKPRRTGGEDVCENEKKEKEMCVTKRLKYSLPGNFTAWQ